MTIELTSPPRISWYHDRKTHILSSVSALLALVVVAGAVREIGGPAESSPAAVPAVVQVSASPAYPPIRERVRGHVDGTPAEDAFPIDLTAEPIFPISREGVRGHVDGTSAQDAFPGDQVDVAAEPVFPVHR